MLSSVLVRRAALSLGDIGESPRREAISDLGRPAVLTTHAPPATPKSIRPSPIETARASRSRDRRRAGARDGSDAPQVQAVEHTARLPPFPHAPARLEGRGSARPLAPGSTDRRNLSTDDSLTSTWHTGRFTVELRTR